jgi:uncharacterized protein YerC
MNVDHASIEQDIVNIMLELQTKLKDDPSSAVQISEDTGVSAKTISRLLNLPSCLEGGPTYYPSTRTIARLCKRYGLLLNCKTPN